MLSSHSSSFSSQVPPSLPALDFSHLNLKDLCEISPTEENFTRLKEEILNRLYHHPETRALYQDFTLRLSHKKIKKISQGMATALEYFASIPESRFTPFLIIDLIQGYDYTITQDSFWTKKHWWEYKPPLKQEQLTFFSHLVDIEVARGFSRALRKRCSVTNENCHGMSLVAQCLRHHMESTAKKPLPLPSFPLQDAYSRRSFRFTYQKDGKKLRKRLVHELCNKFPKTEKKILEKTFKAPLPPLDEDSWSSLSTASLPSLSASFPSFDEELEELF